MKLLELQDVLGERIRIAIDPNITQDDRKAELVISQTIATLAKQMINNADIVLRANKLIADGKLVNAAIEKMI